MKVKVWYEAWKRPEIFNLIQHEGNVDEMEMRRVFNLGIGYCLIVPDNVKWYVMDYIRKSNMDCWEIGEVV